jgi:uncharacterized protein (DUF58 family)
MITGRTALLCALGVLILPFVPLPGVAVAGILGALLLACLLDWLIAGSIRKLHTERSGATQTRLGETVSVTLVVRNDGRRKVRARVRDAWVPSAGASPYLHRATLRSGQARVLETVLTPTRRGDRPASRVTIRSYGPLGLAYRQSWRRRAQLLTPPWTIRTLPPFTSRRFLAEKLSRLRQLDGSLAIRARGQGTEFDALREYVDGDDVRSIDWRATARRQTVVVRTWRPERDRRLVCVIDTGRTSAARVGDMPRLDAALDACLLLAAVAAKAGDRVDLLAADTAIRGSVSGASRQSVLPELVQAMATLEPKLAEPNFGLMVSEVMRRARKRCLVVLFTAIEPAALADGLLPVLGQLTSKHTVVLASVGDPTVAEMATRRGDTEAIYSAAAAERTLGERRQIIAALRRRGVEVVDEPADIFPSKVADAYLALKAAGQL